MVRGDLTALRMALADSLTYAHSSRVHDTKAEFLDLLTRGQFSYKPIIPEARSVRVYGGAGIVTGTARMEITARGHDTRFRIRYLAYARVGRDDRDGIWDRSTSAQNPTGADVGHQSQA